MLSCLLRSGCRVFAFHSALSFKLDLVSLFFAVISVWPKSMSMSLLDFHLYFAAQKCQCFAMNLASVTQIMDSGLC